MAPKSTVPTPRPAETSSAPARTSDSRLTSSTPSSHNRRPSISVSPSLMSTSPRAVPVPVPQRHGSLYGHSHRPSVGSPNMDSGGTPMRTRGHVRGSGSSGSASLSGSFLLGPASVPSSSFFGVADASVQRSRSEMRPSEARSELHTRSKSIDKQGIEMREEWLDITANDILAGRNDASPKMLLGGMITEEAVEVSSKNIFVADRYRS